MLRVNCQVSVSHVGKLSTLSLMIASGEVLSEGYGHGGPGVCLGDGQAEADGVTSQGGRGDALLRRTPTYLTWPQYVGRERWKLSTRPLKSSTDLCLPAPVITWYLSNQPVKPSKYFKMTSHQGQHTLSITEAFPEDEGPYRCTAVSPAGEVSTTATLKVRRTSRNIWHPIWCSFHLLISCSFRHSCVVFSDFPQLGTLPEILRKWKRIQLF